MAAFETGEYRDRVQRVSAGMADAGVDTLVVFSEPHMCFLTGYEGRSDYVPQVTVIRAGDQDARVNLREMERWEAVRKVPVRGDRRSFYEANLDILGIIRAQLREGLERRMGEAERALEGIENALGASAASAKGADNGAVKVMKERLSRVRETEAAVKTLLSTFL